MGFQNYSIRFRLNRLKIKIKGDFYLQTKKKIQQKVKYKEQKDKTKEEKLKETDLGKCFQYEMQRFCQ